MNLRGFVLAAAALVQAAPDGQGARKVTVDSGEVVRLHVRVSTEKESFTSVLELSGGGRIREIVQGFDKEDVSLEVKGGRLFAKLLSPIRGFIDVLSDDGKLVRVLVSPGGENVHDSLVRVRFKKPPKGKSRRRAVHPPALVLAKAMRAFEVPEGAAVSRADGEPLVHRAGALELRLLFVYRFRGLTGYVCRLGNLLDEDFLDVDLSRFRGEGLVLSGAKDLSVQPGDSTLVYFVFDGEAR